MECVACGNNNFKQIDNDCYECQTCGSRFTLDELREFNDSNNFEDENTTTYFENELAGEENLARFSSSLNLARKRNLRGIKIILTLIAVSVIAVIVYSTIGLNLIAKKEYGPDIRALSVGDIFYFGEYEQDANESNGPEKILWEVIAEEDNKLLLLSAYSLDCKEYGDWVKDIVYWENSYTREWLNDTFYDEAFNKYQKSLIVKSKLINEDNSKYTTDAGPDTKDNVFLLSEDEFNNYITGTMGVGINTEYTSRQGLGGKSQSRRTIWRLRTPGKDSQYVSCANALGELDLSGVGVSESLPVRPAIWISKN